MNHQQSKAIQQKLQFASLFPAIFGREVIINQNEDGTEESYFYLYQGSLYVYRFFFKFNVVVLEKDDQLVDKAVYDEDGLEFYRQNVMLRTTTKALVDRSPTLAQLFQPEGRLLREEDIIGLVVMSDVMEMTRYKIRLNLYSLKRTDFFEIRINPDGKFYDIIKNGRVTVWEHQAITPEKDIFALVERFSADRAKALAKAIPAWGGAWTWNASEGDSALLFIGRNPNETVRIECQDIDKQNLKIMFNQHPTFFLQDHQSFSTVVGILEEATPPLEV